MTPAVGAAAQSAPARRRCGWSPSRWCTARPAARRSASRRTCGRPAATGRDFDLGADEPQAARAVPRRHHHRQQHRRAQRRGVHDAGDRRRSLPLERGVPDPDAPEADAGLGRPRRHLARPDVRAAASARTRRFRRCSCASRTSTSRGGCSYGYSCTYTDSISWASPDAAAADGARPARGLRLAVRRRRHAGRAARAPGRGQEPARLAVQRRSRS